MGKDQGQGKAGVTPTSAQAPGVSPPAPGKRTLDSDEDAAGDVDVAGASTSGQGPSVFGVRLPASVTGKPKPPDLTVHPDEYISGAIEKFRIALAKGDSDGATYAWEFASPKDKRAFGASASINRDLLQVVRVIGPRTVQVMAEAGLDFAGRGDLIEYILEVGFPHWFDGLDDHGGKILTTFLEYLPARDKLDGAALKKLDRLITGMNSIAIVRPLFERIYVPLSDTTYNAKRVRTTKWQADHVHRLYKALSAHLPVAHVRAVRSFHLGTEEYEGGTWKPLKNAWWNSNGYVVLPEKNADDGGTKDHRMTGGGRAHMDPDTKKGATQGAMEKFAVGALHEVGHAVGDSLGGHAYARTNAFADWQTSMTVDAWSKGLWGDDTALTARAAKKAGDDKAISSQAARTFLAQDLTGSATLSPFWDDPDAFEAALLKQYGDQPLVKYWRKWNGSDDKGSSYQFSGTDNYGKDGRVYVWLSRGKNGYSSYTQQAHQQKVSWYSLASPHEWWAEQYAHYYRTGKDGHGIDAATKTKLAEYDSQTPVAPQQPPAGAGQDSDADSDVAETKHRLPFPW